jgi:hypothetical protein
MTYDLLDELRLEPYRHTNTKRKGINARFESSFDQPDKEKWKAKDCPKCNGAFCVISIDKGKGKLCLNCGDRD